MISRIEPPDEPLYADLTPEQQAIVDRFFPEQQQEHVIHMNEDGEIESVEDREDVLWENQKKFDERAMLVEFFMYPERFGPTDFAIEVVYRRTVPGTKDKTVWGVTDLSGLDLSRIRNVSVTIDMDNDIDPPCINVHAEVRKDSTSEWQQVVSGNLHTSVDAWIKRKMGATPTLHKYVGADVRVIMLDEGRKIKNTIHDNGSGMQYTYQEPERRKSNKNQLIR